MVQILINSKGYNMNPIQSLYYVSPACMMSLLVPFLAVELGELRTRTDWVFNPSVMLANALTAFILNLVGVCWLASAWAGSITTSAADAGLLAIYICYGTMSLILTIHAFPCDRRCSS